MARDVRNDQALEMMGWTVLHFWGKDIKNKTEDCVRAVKDRIFDIKAND